MNDLSHFSDEEIVRNYEQILTGLSARKVARVVVCAVLPVTESCPQSNSAWFRGHRITNPRIQGLNDQVRGLCARCSGVLFVDANGALSDPVGNLRAEFSDDGVHLQEAGNRVWADALRRLLRDTN